MVNVYEVKHDSTEAYQFISVETGISDFNTIYLRDYIFDGSIGPEEFPELPYRFSNGQYVDFPQMNYTAIGVREKPWMELAKLVRDYVQDYRVSIGKETVYLLNVLAKADLVDENLSKIKRHSSGRIMMIEKIAIKSEFQSKSILFRIPQLPSRIYCTDDFKQFVEKNAYTGLNFVEIS